MSSTFIPDHGTIITAALFLMFGASAAYTVYVIVLDWREHRAEVECPWCEGSGVVETDPDWGMVSAEDCRWCEGTGVRWGTIGQTDDTTRSHR